jgi:hypothetical protein
MTAKDRELIILLFDELNKKISDIQREQNEKLEAMGKKILNKLDRMNKKKNNKGVVSVKKDEETPEYPKLINEVKKTEKEFLYTEKEIKNMLDSAFKWGC